MLLIRARYLSSSEACFLDSLSQLCKSNDWHWLIPSGPLTLPWPCSRPLSLGPVGPSSLSCGKVILKLSPHSTVDGSRVRRQPRSAWRGARSLADIRVCLERGTTVEVRTGSYSGGAHKRYDQVSHFPKVGRKELWVERSEVRQQCFI